QAVARNSSGNVLQNQAVGLLITIHDINQTGTVLYSESFTPTTNQFGLFTVQIGTGTVTSGSFAAINWAVNDKYMEIGMDPTGGNSYIQMGFTQLITVPYAIVSEKATNMNSNDLTDVDTTGTANGKVLKWNGTAWAPATDISGSGADNWGTQTVVSDFTLSGNGTSTSPLKLASQSATLGDVLKWTGSAWSPQPDASFTMPYSNTVSSANFLIDISNNTTGGTFRGTSASTTNAAIYGKLTAGAGAAYLPAIRGENQATGGFGIGVYGSHAGSGWGVYGTTLNGGVGVFGDGIVVGSIGVQGQVSATSGIAVKGTAFNGAYSGIFTGGNFGIGTASPTAQLDVAGTGTASAIHTTSSTVTSPALEVSGTIKVSGANPFAFTVMGQNTTATATGYIVGNQMIINNPICNNDPNAILIVTHNYSANNNNTYCSKDIGAYYDGSSGKWILYTEDSSGMPTTAFNILVIKQ
ncbi:MAG TPA: hypothetical protein VFJ43_07840, partial [Bacteroidia bacterium]|nr:hypothetical protein [Bacteroidia bacterium]